MKIKLLTGVAGADFSHAPGEIVDMDAETANRMVESGQGEFVTVTKPRKRKNVSEDSNE